jgi:hypothetical protein
MNSLDRDHRACSVYAKEGLHITFCSKKRWRRQLLRLPIRTRLICAKSDPTLTIETSQENHLSGIADEPFGLLAGAMTRSVPKLNDLDQFLSSGDESQMKLHLIKTQPDCSLSLNGEAMPRSDRFHAS